MSHFYGVITTASSGRSSTRCGYKSGLTTIAASHNGAIRVELSHDAGSGKDSFKVILAPWDDYTGPEHVICEGEFPTNENPA